MLCRAKQTNQETNKQKTNKQTNKGPSNKPAPPDELPHLTKKDRSINACWKDLDSFLQMSKLENEKKSTKHRVEN